MTKYDMIAYKSIYVKPGFEDRVDRLLTIVIDSMQQEFPNAQIDIDADWTITEEED